VGICAKRKYMPKHQQKSKKHRKSYTQGNTGSDTLEKTVPQLKNVPRKGKNILRGKE